MNLLNKHLLSTIVTIDENKVYKFLRRINRETKTQYISDVQRACDWGETNNKWVNFQIIARRYRKNKLFLNDKSISDYYGNCKLVENNSLLIGDTDFKEMFKIVPGNNRDDLFKYGLNSRNSFFNLFQSKKTKPFLCCLDTGYIGQYLKETFNVPVYIVDRMYNEETSKHFSLGHDEIYDKYQRNAIFYQVTSSGNDKKIITTEENRNNSPIILWFFENHIVYCKATGYSEW